MSFEFPETINELTKNTPELSKERLADIQTLEVSLDADFGSVLEDLRRLTGIDLQPRSDGYHLTIISPTESKILKTLDDEMIAELQKINHDIQNGQGIAFKGIGFIDGESSEFNLREVDRVKKTSFLVVDIPALQEFRAKIGLPPKEFHITLGFVGGDIHFRVVGQEPIKPNSPKMKDITAPIPKQPNHRFDSIVMPEIIFKGLDGQVKH